MTQTLRVFESFAGIGTQRMALDNLNIPHEVVAISEVDKYAIQSYQAIHGHTLNLGDISQIEPKDIPDHDLFTYSFPCTDLSTVGLRQGFQKGSGTASSLLWECEKVIQYKRPRYLLMENVKALLSRNNLPLFNNWLHVLEEYGYQSYYQNLNALDYGIPQNRERVFVLSVLEGQPSYTFKEPQPLTRTLTDYLETEVDERYYLKEERVEQLLKERQYEPNKTYGKQAIYLANEPSIEILGTVNYTATPRFQRSIKAQISRTLKAGNQDVSVVLRDNRTHKVSIRRLTSLECWRLMGIKDEDFHKAQEVCSNTQLQKQAGNAIVVQVLEALFSQLNFKSE